MPYFAMSYQALFHDTMAYGSTHHTANIKFQNIARETILFEASVNGEKVWRQQLKDIILLTREVYSLNLAPVELGGKVGILLTYEDPSRSTVKLCFRVVREDGQPVACGYQTMICMNKDTFELVPAPQLISQYMDPYTEDSLIEELVDPCFSDRTKLGGRELKRIFTAEICELGKSIATAPLAQSYPKIIDKQGNEFPIR